MFPPESTVGDVGERVLLAHLRARIPVPSGVILGPGDDAALLATGPVTVMTTDALVEGVHFRRNWSTARQVGRKALSVNLSDVGAMAGRARYATVSLCLPEALPLAWVDALYDGLLGRAAETGLGIVGGNVSAIAGPVVIDVAMLGESDRPLRRAGALVGDALMVTGTLGLAAAGLAFLRAGARLHDDGRLDGLVPEPGAEELGPVRNCVRAQLDPDPPLAFAAALAAFDGVHAGMDLSDGLSADLHALCAESAVSAVVRSGALPLGPSFSAWPVGPPQQHALHGGEDYQLLLAVAPGRVEALQALAAAHGVRLTLVGSCQAGEPSAWLAGESGVVPLEPRGHEHFAPRREGRG